MLRFFILILFFLSLGEARTITDMAGRQVTVDESLTKVFGASPPTTYLVALYRPEALVGLNFPLDNANNRGSAILDPRLKPLPILKGWHGNAGGASAEKLLELGTQAIIGWKNAFLEGAIERSLHGAKIPVIYIEPDELRKLPETFRFLGRLFGDLERGEALAAYAEHTNARLAALRAKVKRPKRVYYALGPKGLLSECSDSFHAPFIEAAGGVNVNRCEQSSLVGMEQLSFESLLLEQPDAIFVQDPSFYHSVFADPKWKLLKAVQERQVFYIPKSPINWLDRPPSFMRLIGTQWVASKLYPELYDGDIAVQTRDYLKLFFGYEADAEALEKVFNP